MTDHAHTHLAPTGLSIRCDKHPAYRAIRKPAVECEACQYMYDQKGKLLVCVVGEFCATPRETAAGTLPA